MAFITADIKVPGMNRSIQTSLYFPTDLPDEVGNKVNGVITLLHGYGNAAQDWMTMTSAPRYAADNGYILVAPSAGNSFYMDMAFGDRWYTLLTGEFQQQLHRIFRLPEERDKNFIAGLSMGGYGALRIALANPGRYAACGSFSGCLDLKSMIAGMVESPINRSRAIALVGEELALPREADVFALTDEVSLLPAEQQPRVFCTCGEQDEDATRIRTQNIAYAGFAREELADFTYREWPGVHEFNFWDRSLAEFIGFLRGNDYAAKKRADWTAGAL